MQEYIVGIDLGGMSAKAALFDAEGKNFGQDDRDHAGVRTGLRARPKSADRGEGRRGKGGRSLRVGQGGGDRFPRRGQQQNGRGAQMGKFTAGSTFPWEKRWKS